MMQANEENIISMELPYYEVQGNEITLFESSYKSNLPMLLKGPTGCGKTRLVQHMAARLKRPLYTVACHDDLTASDLVGRHLIEGGSTYWQDGPLTKAVRNGGICYLDEVVEARKDTIVVLHPLTDDRRTLSVERTGEVLHCPPEFMLVVSYNPGYQNLLKGMKPSTRQRFVAATFEYPSTETEVKILVKETGIDKAIASQLVRLASGLRKLKDIDLEEAPSTRLLVYASELILAGIPARDACLAAIIEPLTDDQETAKILMDVVDAIFT
jgi:nitric oxide reductase NorQ protein